MEKITIIGGSDSYGVPYTPDNIEMKSHFHYVVEYLKEQGYDVSAIEFYNTAHNKTGDFDDYFLKNHSVAELKKRNRIFVGEYLKRTKFPATTSFTKKYYVVDEEDKKAHITTELQNSPAPIFIYSCGRLDALQSFGLDPSLNYKKLFKALIHPNKTLTEIAKDMKQNLITIKQYNPNTFIYVLGNYKVIGGRFLSKILPTFGFFNTFNKKVKEACEEINTQYGNVHFVNIDKAKKHISKGDIHPNAIGQKVIGQEIIEKVKKSYVYTTEKK